MEHDDRAPVFLFLHVMKSGGTSFTEHLDANVPTDRSYPDAPRGPLRRQQYTMIDELRAHVEANRDRTLAYSGHFPYAVTEFVPADVVLSVLRNPVDRTISALRHFKVHDTRFADLPLEAIYEDPWVYPMHLHDYQVKQFAMTSSDRLESHMDVVDIDDDRFRTAVGNADRVDVLGLTEHYDDFCSEMADRFGWYIGPVRRMRVSDTGDRLPRGFERRIRADNEADVEFYEQVRSIVARRRAGQRVYDLPPSGTSRPTNH